MRRSTTALMATGLVGALFVAAPGLAQNTILNNKYENSSVEFECRDANDELVGTITYNGPLYMWPPNHKYQDISIVAQAEDEEDGVELFTSGSHDEVTEDGEMNGAGNTDDDVSPATDMDSGTGSATTNHALRSERSGQGDGRLYTLDWDVIFTDDDGDGGYGTVYCGSADLNDDGEPPVDAQADAFEVLVPHDMRGGAGWKHDTDGDGQGDKGKHGRDD